MLRCAPGYCAGQVLTLCTLILILQIAYCLPFTYVPREGKGHSALELSVAILDYSAVRLWVDESQAILCAAWPGDVPIS